MTATVDGRRPRRSGRSRPYDDGDAPRRLAGVARRDRTRRWAARCATLAGLGVGPAPRVLWCSVLSESAHFWPLLIGTMISGGQFSLADATSADALRVAMFAPAASTTTPCSASTKRSSTGSTSSDAPYAEVFGGVADRRRAARRVRTPGRRRPHAALVRAVRPGRRDRDRARRPGARRRGGVVARRRRRPHPRHQPANRARRPSTARRPRSAAGSSTDHSFVPHPTGGHRVTERTLKDRAAIVGVGATPYYRRGPGRCRRRTIDLAIKAILAALDDAGLGVDDVDGFALYGGAFIDTSLLAQILGIPEVRFTAGSPAAAAGRPARSGSPRRRSRPAWPTSSCQRAHAAAGEHALRRVVRAEGQGRRRARTPRRPRRSRCSRRTPGSWRRARCSRCSCSGTCTSTARRASTSPRSRSPPATTRSAATTSLMQEPLTREQYFDARMISEPFCLYDYCMECDGAVAVITTTPERAATCATRRCTSWARRTAAPAGGARRSRGWACPTSTSRRRATARSRSACTTMAGVGPDDVDVALLYDHFTGMVLLQLEDYGFCGIGESGAVRRRRQHPLARRRAAR